MAISLKYGKVDIPGIGDNEPVFIGRSQDRLMVRQMEYYWMEARAQGCDADHLKAIDAQRSAMVSWTLEHETKLPDTKLIEPDPEPEAAPELVLVPSAELQEAKIPDERASGAGSTPDEIKEG
jgi:hypothetical protein